MTHPLNKAATIAARLNRIYWTQVERTVICAGDIRQPWQSVYGFPLTAASLAAHRVQIIHCREDEIFDLLARLNDLTEQPQTLGRVYVMLHKLAVQTCDRLARLLQFEDTSLTDREGPTLVEHLERLLAVTSEQKVADRLKLLLAPNDPIQEIAGLSRQLAGLLQSLRGLRMVKEQGFHVVVYDRYRMPRRSGLEERRDEPLLLADRPTYLPAGFLLPPVTHQTLWTYFLVRSDRGQSTVWN